MKFGRFARATLTIGVVFLAGRMVGHFSARSEAQVAPAPAAERTTAQIARERLNVAEEGLTLVRDNLKLGQGSALEITMWIRRRAIAASDLPDKAERITLLKDCATQMDQQLRQTEQMQRLGIIHGSDVRSAKYDALEIELLLAKARESR